MISVDQISQLKDNYCYSVIEKKNIIIIDPAEPEIILKYIKKNKFKLKAIFLTHHHSDHTAGVEKIVNNISVPVYSPNKKIKYTSKILKDLDIIDLGFIKFEIFATPGHTMDHIVLYNKKNNILFSGDTLFRLGCGRVFEGTYSQMFSSMMKISSLDDKTNVYCGHEYTKNNLKFLLSIFPENQNLLKEKTMIYNQIEVTNNTMPFNLGKEKDLNPFLNPESDNFLSFRRKKDLSGFGLFTHLRDLKNKI